MLDLRAKRVALIAELDRPQKGLLRVGQQAHERPSEVD